MTTDHQYWLFDWLDQYSVKDLDKARKLLSNEAAREEMRSLAKGSASNRHQDRVNSILAGRGIDLSGHLDCNGASCRRRQVDELFRRVWHYFDKIVVADAVRHEVGWHWNQPSEQVREWVLSHIDVLLYLRQIGAESLLEFSEKPALCENHWRQHAAETGLDALLQSADETILELVNGGTWDFTPDHDGGVNFVFSHPAFRTRSLKGYRIAQASQLRGRRPKICGPPHFRCHRREISWPSIGKHYQLIPPTDEATANEFNGTDCIRTPATRLG